MYAAPMQCKRKEIYIANLDPVEGCEQGGIRPVVVVQNDWGNHFSPTTIIAPITSNLKKQDFPTHVVCQRMVGLPHPSMVLCEQPRTITKERLQRCVGYLTDEQMLLVSLALKNSLALR